MGEVAATGAYISVEPPHRVVFSWGIPGSDALPPGNSTIEVVLTPDGDDTMVCRPPTSATTAPAGSTGSDGCALQPPDTAA